MTMTDPISDLLTRIRNGQMVKKPKITCPASKIKVAILKVLQEEGYIRGFEIIEDEKGKQLEISLKYFDGYIFFALIKKFLKTKIFNKINCLKRSDYPMFSAKKNTIFVFAMLYMGKFFINEND